MKLKYYMRGLGIGIILTALVLSISYHSARKNDLSDKEIINRAEKLGMVMQEESSLDVALDNVKNSKPSPEVTPLITVTPALTLAATLTPSETPEPTLAPVPTVAPEPTLAPEPTIAPEPTETISTSDETSDITFTVLKGMDSGDVADVLFQNGLISDVHEFDQYLIGIEKASHIKAGTFTLPKNATYEEIADKLVIE